MFERYRALTENHQPESESLSAQRDRANASAQEAWQRVAELEAALKRVVDWLDRLAVQSETQAKDTRFATLSEACAADAKNYRATAKPLRALLAKGGK